MGRSYDHTVAERFPGSNLKNLAARMYSRINHMGEIRLMEASGFIHDVKVIVSIELTKV